MDKKIAVLIPCYNEEKTVKKVAEDFLNVLPNATIYIYDNNSTDKTYEIAKSIKGNVVVRKEYKQGKGNVVRSMFRQIDADCYIMIDGDDTYPAKHAPLMCELILNENYDMVIGDRLSSTYFTENKRAFHNFGNVLVRFLINLIFKSNVKDIMTGYRAFSYSFVKTMPIISDGFEIETEMTINALDKKFNLAEIPIEYRDRPEGSVSKLNTFRDGFKVLKTIFTMFKDYKPMMFFGIISALILIIAIFLFIPVLTGFMHTGFVEKFPTLIVCGALSSISFISFGVGLVLDCLVKKNKQDFIIKVNMFTKNGDE